MAAARTQARQDKFALCQPAMIKHNTSVPRACVYACACLCEFVFFVLRPFSRPCRPEMLSAGKTPGCGLTRPASQAASQPAPLRWPVWPHPRHTVTHKYVGGRPDVRTHLMESSVKLHGNFHPSVSLTMTRPPERGVRAVQGSLLNGRLSSKKKHGKQRIQGRGWGSTYWPLNLRKATSVTIVDSMAGRGGLRGGERQGPYTSTTLLLVR